MSRVTLRLPESLHESLAQRAREEGTTLNQLIVYLLTRMTTAAELQGQQEVFEELRHRYPVAEAEAALRDLLATRV